MKGGRTVRVRSEGSGGGLGSSEARKASTTKRRPSGGQVPKPPILWQRSELGFASVATGAKRHIW